MLALHAAEWGVAAETQLWTRAKVTQVLWVRLWQSDPCSPINLWKSQESERFDSRSCAHWDKLHLLIMSHYFGAFFYSHVTPPRAQADICNAALFILHLFVCTRLTRDVWCELGVESPSAVNGGYECAGRGTQGILEPAEFNKHQSYKILRELKANTTLPSLISRIHLGSAFGIIFLHEISSLDCLMHL